MRVLVVEDNRELASQVAGALRQAGYVVDWSAQGEEGALLGETGSYGVAILDLGLPFLDGLSILGRWRGRGITTPVLILSARDTWRDKVTGLRAGADDYLAKPFAMDELLARVEALLRRGAGEAATTVTHGNLTLEQGARQVLLDGAPLRLTTMEYRILACLMLRKGRVVTRGELAEQVYEHGVEGESNTLEVLINRLRKKIGAEHIVTQRGMGYLMPG